MKDSETLADHSLSLLQRRRRRGDSGRRGDIEPEKLAVIGVKAAVAHRRAYDKIASKMLWADTPGPCRSDLAKLPFRKVRRPVFPLDS